ncbi:MAG: hypothetical protein R3E64_12050 [Halioglobus sp.]
MAGDSDKHDYLFISGVFYPDEANQVLMTLIEDKINFHRKNIWSRRERFGETDTVGSRRIVELRQTKADITALIEQAESSEQRLRINCTIEITLTPD